MDGVQLTSTLQSYYEEISIVLIAFKMQLTWIKPASRLTLPNLAGSFKKSKKPGFSWVSWVCCQGNKTQPVELVTIWVLEPSYPTGYLGSGTQITMLLHFRTPLLLLMTHHEKTPLESFTVALTQP